MGIIPEALKRITSVQQVFITEKDETSFPHRKPKYTPLIKSPLKQNKHHHRHLGHGKTLFASVNATHEGTDTQQEALDEEEDEEEREIELLEDGEPELHRARETSVVQLFYDLFFVANLTTFTSVHEISDTDSLRSYIGFFVILWGTWFQVAKYDVRFGNDSAFERICKALQFGVMVGFAITGPNFDVTFETDTPAAILALQTDQTLTLILMASRLILTVQYLSVFWWLKEFPRARMPLIIHAVTSLGAALIFLGLYFSFDPSSPGNAGLGIIGWYVAFAVEAAIILGASAQVSFLSFIYTPMVERLGLLTLIILGEGIIALCGAIQKVGSSLSFTGDVIGQIISGVGIIYFIWMLYYDQTEKKRVGRLRQELWTILHFPFHICILLLVEGQATLTVWLKILDLINPIYDTAFDIPYFDPNSPVDVPPRGAALTSYLTNLNSTIQAVFKGFPTADGSTSVPWQVEDALVSLMPGVDNYTYFDGNISTIYYNSFTGVCNLFQIEAPKQDLTSDNNDSSGQQSVADITNIFFTVYTYFFIAAGLTLIALTLLLRLGRREKYRTEFFVMTFRYLIGIGLALLALMNLPSLQLNNDHAAIYTYIGSPWMLPTVLLSYLLVVVVDNLVAYHIRKKYLNWRSNSLGVAV
ncbi:hypothetical protein MMC11_005733 [Xylographa trunciseda]|nr:hypothetical protein [Xylographa trunciseda]